MPYVSCYEDKLSKESAISYQRPNSIEYIRGSDGTNSSNDYQTSKEIKFRKREREKESLLPSARRPANVTAPASYSRFETAPKTREEIEAGAYSAGAVKSS